MACALVLGDLSAPSLITSQKFWTSPPLLLLPGGYIIDDMKYLDTTLTHGISISKATPILASYTMLARGSSALGCTHPSH